MPRPVVPIFAAPAASSRMRSRSWCSGRIKGVFSAIIRFAGEIATPCAASLPISAISAHGSSTTPLPITLSLPGRTIPDGSSDSL